MNDWRYISTGEANIRMLKAYRAAVETMLDLHDLIRPRTEEDNENYLPGKPGATAEVIDGIIKYIIPEFPPHIRNDDILQAKLKKHWISMIVYATAKANINIQFEKAFCLIRMYNAQFSRWDVDNRVFTHIINGLRNSKIIKDDSCQYFSFMVEGIKDNENIKTELFVLDYKKIGKYIQTILG